MKIVPCTREHIPGVVDLLAGPVSSGGDAAHAAQCRYLEQVYLENPWCCADLPSLVCEHASGRIDGFLGVIPRPMVLNGELLRAASTSKFKVRGVEEGMRNPLAAILLMKTFLAGPQDISIAERANDRGKRIWEACGGSTVRLYSFDWFRPIRPARALLELAELARAGHRSRLPGLQSIADLADLLGAPVVQRFMPDRGPSYTLAPLDEHFAIDAVAHAEQFDLKPRYDLASFNWMLEMSRRRALGGHLRTIVVKDEAARKIGWFVYIQPKERARVGLVLQLVALQGHLETVLRAVIQDASVEGVALLRGAVEPTELNAYDRSSCLLNTGNRWMLVHSRQSRILDAFLYGKALITGFEGEWWLLPFSLGSEAFS